MRKDFLLYTLLCFVTLSCKAQQPPLHTDNKKAIALYYSAQKNADGKLFDEAEKDLKKAVEADGRFVEAHLMLGDILYYEKKYDESIAAYKYGIGIDAKAFPNSIMSLGKLEHSRGLYADAITHYKQFLGLDVKIDQKLKTLAEKSIDLANFAIGLMEHPVPYNPVSIGDGVNTPNREYSFYLTVDEQTAVYSETRPGADNPAKLNEDVYSSTFKDNKWTVGKPLPGAINTADNEGSECISPDGQYLFYTGCQRPDGFGSCDLYVAVKSGGVWGEPFNLGEGVNSNKWDTHPSFSADGHTLYFVSTRPGGQGKADIWKVTLGEDGLFGTPENLGPEINTPEDEFTPFIHPDGKSLYFASKGQPGLGGFDLFLSRKADDGSWQKPVNLGYPINTIADEMSLFVGSCSGKAYISSEKPGGAGLMDIYCFDLYGDASPAKVTYIKGTISDKNTKMALGGIAKLVDLKTKKEIASAQADVKTGAYMVSLPSGGDYALEISKDGYLFYSANFSLPPNSQCKPYSLNAALSPVSAGEIMVLRNVFFDPDKYDLKQESTVELDKLAAFLNKNPKMAIEISGHTDSDGEDAKNMTLSDNRAKAVVTYLTGKGIDASRLTAKGYGEIKPIAANDTPENKALNRRVEAKVK